MKQGKNLERYSESISGTQQSLKLRNYTICCFRNDLTDRKFHKLLMLNYNFSK